MHNQVIVAAKSFGRAQPQGADMLRHAGLRLVYLTGEKSAHEELSTLMHQEDTVAVIAGAEPIDASMIKASPNLKVIAMHGVGLNHIDQQTAKTCGVEVKAVPGGNAEAVADLAWGLFFAVARKIVIADKAVRSGDWQEKCMGTSINDKTLGIIGFGAIGQAVARRAQGFRMRILAYDVFQNKIAAKSLNANYVSLPELLKNSDFISMHVPLMELTINMIDESELRSMRSSAIIVNTSRGGVINEDALFKALEQGWITGAGLDVFCEEPLPKDHRLINLSNCVLTPHIGARTNETVREIGIKTAENILTILRL
jgi:D-3-phosphoglycerate dehydrogenase